MRAVLTNFGGIIPRYAPHSLSALNASIAHDVKLRNGYLEAWRERCLFAEVPRSRRSLYLHGCCALTWDELVHVAPGAPDWSRLFITGRRGYPEVVEVKCDCDMVYTRLGVPAPLAPVRFNPTAKCGRDVDARSYVYTYVNRWGEESAPSPASASVRVEDGVPVAISGFSRPPSGHDITHIAVYRSATGFREATGKQQQQTTAYLFVDMIPADAVSYTDSLPMLRLGPPLETADDRPPPEGLRLITTLDGTMRFAGATDNQVHFSENYQPHNWPARYDLTLDSTIVHMGSIGNKLYVTTDTTPYVIDTSTCDDAKCMHVIDTGHKLPDIACQYDCSAIETPHGFVYSSPLGLVLINEEGQFVLLTAAWFSADDWAKVSPETVRLAYWQGLLFCVTDRVSFTLQINGKPYDDMTGAELVTISDQPSSMRVSSNGQLYMLQDGRVDVWDYSHDLRPFLWVSRNITSPAHTTPNGNMPSLHPAEGCLWSPASVKVQSVDTEFTLHTPTRGAVYTRKVLDAEPFRLPRVGRHMWYKIQFAGIHKVEFAEIGTMHYTVNQGA